MRFTQAWRPSTRTGCTRLSSIKRPAPAGRDSSTAPATKTARIVFTKREAKVKAPPQSVIDQAAADRAASKAIPPPPLRAPPAPPAPVPRAAAQRAASVPGVKRPETPPKAYKRAPPSPPPQVRFKAAPAPKLPVKQPPSAAAPSGDGTPDFGVPQPDAREPIIACLDWHNTLDIAIEPDGAPKDWLFRTLAKLYRNHFPIQFRIVSYCQARETRESTLRLATQFTRVCNDSIDGLGTPPLSSLGSGLVHLARLQL